MTTPGRVLPEHDPRDLACSLPAKLTDVFDMDARCPVCRPPVTTPGRVLTPMHSCALHEYLAAEVRAGLRDLGLPQSWLAMRLNVSEKHVSQMLTGRAEGSLPMWQDMLASVERWPLGKTAPARTPS